MQSPAFADALKSENIVALKALVAAGEDVNALDADGRTALHEAAKSRPAAVVRALVDAGADVNARDADGRTPLHLAHSDAIDILLKAKADWTLLDGKGNSPAHTAAEKESTRELYRLLEAGVPVDPKNAAGLTPLHFAAQRGSRETVAMLISRKADVNVRTTAPYDYKWTYVAPSVKGMEERISQGSTPLDLALQGHSRNKWSSGGRYAVVADLIRLNGGLESNPSTPFPWLRVFWTPISLAGLLLFAIVLCHLDARLRGWSALSSRFASPTSAPPVGAVVNTNQDGAVGTVGLITLRSMLRVAISDDGLYVAMPSIFRPGHPPLLIPWNQLNVNYEAPGLSAPVVRVSVSVPSAGDITLRGGLASAVAARANAARRPVPPPLPATLPVR